MKLFLDDIRATPDKYDLSFKNCEDLIQWVKENPTVEVELLSLDHDIENRTYDGSAMCRELVELENNIQSIQFHTDNFQALKNMYSIIESANRVGLMPNLTYINPHKVNVIDGEETMLTFYDVRKQ